MAWIKQNLILVISGVAALALIVVATLFLFSNAGKNKAVAEELERQTSELRRLTTRNPFPSEENVKLTREEETRVNAYLDETRRILPPPSEPVKLDDREFKILLENTISSLQRRATNSGMFLPEPRYRFGFAAQENVFQFSPGSTERWLDQLDDIKAICDILFAARVNALEAIRRVPVSRDDRAGMTQMGGDLLAASAKTNGLIVSMPYEVVFRGFTEEVSAVMEGLLDSAKFFIVKSVRVEPSTGDLQMHGQFGMDERAMMMPQPRQPRPQPQARPRPQLPDRSFEDRYGPAEGIGGIGGVQRPQRRPAPVIRQPRSPQAGAPATVISEGPLQVTLLIDAVKVITEEQAAQAAQDAYMDDAQMMGAPGFEEMYY